MPRVNGGVTGQGEEFLFYRADEVLVVGVGEIGAANASAKKRVAGEYHILARYVVGEASR